MITKTIAMRLRHGEILHHVHYNNADLTPLRCRVNGKCKTWKRRPDAYQLPVKHGLRDCFYITPNGANPGEDWVYPRLREMLSSIAGLVPNAPAYAIRDKLLEMDMDLEASLLNELALAQQGEPQ